MFKVEAAFFIGRDQKCLTTRTATGILLLFIILLMSPTLIIFASNQPSVKISHLPIINENLRLTSNIIAESDGKTIDTISLTVTNVAHKNGVPLDPSLLTVRFRDAEQQIEMLPWSWELQGSHNGDRTLDYGEHVQLKIYLQGTLLTPLTANHPFVVEFKPAHGAILSIYRTTPPILTSLIDLQ